MGKDFSLDTFKVISGTLVSSHVMSPILSVTYVTSQRALIMTLLSWNVNKPRERLSLLETPLIRQR